MKKKIKTLLIILISIVISSCSSHKNNELTSKTIYESENLIIVQVSENVFLHTSFLRSKNYGKVPCNGLVIGNKKETIIFDTPIDNDSSEELIKWIDQTLHSKITAIIPTHFHDDCLGGLKIFHKYQIPSYSYYKTIKFAKENNYEVPQNGFKDTLVFKIGDKEVIVKYFGEGHTKDNIVGYYPYKNILFGGCLVKGINAKKGYLGDANLSEWSNTVEKVSLEYPNVKIIVPGHGKYGGKELLDYTINLFQNE